MTYPPAEREDAPRFPHASENSTDSKAEAPRFSLVDEAPNLNKLFNKVKDPESKTSRTSGTAEGKDLFDEVIATDYKHRSSPWGSPKQGADKPAKAAEEEKKDKPSEEIKALPKLTLDEKKDSNSEAASPKNTDTSLPSLSIDTNRIKKVAGDAITEFQNLWGHLSAKVSENGGDKQVQAHEAKPSTVATVDGANWRKDGSQWNLYDSLGNKVEKYQAKVSDVSLDEKGNALIKLNDGRSVKEQKDGSTLEYDAKNKLAAINYKDGSSRKFEWDGDQLVGMASKTGEFTRNRDASGKPIDEWVKKGSAAGSGWKGEIKVEQKTGELSIGSVNYKSDLGVEKVNADGSRELTCPNKDLVKTAKNGTISEISYADGSTRKFTWETNPNSKGDDDKYNLTAVQVSRDGKNYFHTRQENGSWQSQTYENGAWSAAKPATLSFEVNNKTREYSYVDSSDGIKHIRQAGGAEKEISRDGVSLEYKNGNLVRVSKGDSAREFDWKDGKVVAIKDGVQGKNWKQTSAGVWESDKGDKRHGAATISPTGEIAFKKGDKSSVIKMDGEEYQRVENAKEKSSVDLRKGEVQVTAADGSTRKFTTSEDGKELLKESSTRDGKTQSWTRAEQLPNGNYSWVNDQDPSKKEERVSVTQADGKLNIEYPDGKKFQANTSGTERLENSKEGWYTDYKDGHPAESKFPDGTVRRYTFDGPGELPKTIEVTSPDKSVTTITKLSDGVYNYKSGSTDMKWNAQISVSRDGTYKIVDADEKGKTTTRELNGRMLIDNPIEKSRIEKFNGDIVKVSREGKEVELIRDKDKSVTEIRDYTNNTSFKKNEAGEFVPGALNPDKPYSKPDEILRKGAVTLDDKGTLDIMNDEGRLVRQKLAEKAQVVSCKEKALRDAVNNESMTAEQKAELRKNVLELSTRSDLSNQHKATFHESLSKFALRTDISDQEKADTYKQLNRLLESKSDKAFNSKERAELACQLAWHIGNPEANAQGSNPNCQVTTVRGRLLSDAPSQFARMMTDVISTGQFVSKDKSVIKPPRTSFKVGVGSEESKFPPEDGSRTWMGKISDVTIANIHWQRQSKAPSGELVNPGQLVYRQDPPTGRKDTGGRLYKEPGDGYMYAQNNTDGKAIDQPHLYAKDIADAYRQIVGKNQENVILAVERKDVSGGPGVGLVDEEKLHEILSKEKGTHIAQIWTGTDWVWKEPARHFNFKPSDTTDGEHVVLIKDYDPKTRTVGVDNSWSSRYDRLAPDRRISLHDLYKAMAKQE